MRVLVTRPATDAARTAQRLMALGHECLTVPLTTLRPVSFDWPTEPLDAIVVTSSNAIAALPAGAAAPSIPLFAVGERTAAAARAHGFTDVRTGAGDAAALTDTITSVLPAPARLLYLAGVDRKPTLEAGLAARGHVVIVLETYEVAPVDALPRTLADALAGRRLDAALHYSRRSAAIFCRLSDGAGLSAAAAALAHHCLSADTAEPLLALGAGRLAIAADPTETSLIATLSR